jgi:uncharacterized protein YbjT (DUF2867 family)
MMILVCGATGTVGSKVVRQLSQAGIQCRAMVHDPGKADFLRSPNTEIVQGEFARPETLSGPLAGVDRVFLAARPGPQQPELEGNMIRACQQAGVEGLVKLSMLGAAPHSGVPYCHWNGQIEQHLRQSGVPWTVLRPNYFMQNLLQFADSLLSEGAFHLPMGDARISQIDARDVAAVAVACLTQRECQSEAYLLTGPQAISFSDCADALTNVLGRPTEYQPVSAEEARTWMRKARMPDWEIEADLAGAEAYVRGAGSQVTHDVQAVLGRPATSFAQFAQDYAPAFLRATPEAEIGIRKAA